MPLDPAAPETPAAPAARGSLAGWGRLPVPGHERLSERLEPASAGAVLSRGLGRSYGDSSLPPPGFPEVLGTRLADRILAFDPTSGRIRVEAGLCLAELNRLLMPRGFFTPVTPGTKFVTIGGMVASDVHGKNHHESGCFGDHVTALRLRVADGRVLDCTAEHERDLFRATIGGMGLTGHILEVEFTLSKIPTGWIYSHSERVPDIDTYIAKLKEAGPKWPFTMGWIDCVSRGKNLGRGILIVGRWATRDEAPAGPPPAKKRIRLPVELPNWALNRVTARVFNGLYYWKHLRRSREGVVHPDGFFYPLDQILEWNKGYGARGFTQYQCVLPDEAGQGAAREFLELLTQTGAASPLCVIKDCGPEGVGLLSFPKPGISIAVDMAIRPDIQEVVDRLNRFVIDRGGRIYLTKDAFTRPEHYRAMEPRLDEFQGIRRTWDPAARLRSAQSVRVLGDPPWGESP